MHFQMVCVQCANCRKLTKLSPAHSVDTATWAPDRPLFHFMMHKNFHGDSQRNTQMPCVQGRATCIVVHLELTWQHLLSFISTNVSLLRKSISTFTRNLYGHNYGSHHHYVLLPCAYHWFLASNLLRATYNDVTILAAWWPTATCNWFYTHRLICSRV